MYKQVSRFLTRRSGLSKSLQRVQPKNNPKVTCEYCKSLIKETGYQKHLKKVHPDKVSNTHSQAT